MLIFSNFYLDLEKNENNLFILLIYDKSSCKVSTIGGDVKQ